MIDQGSLLAICGNWGKRWGKGLFDMTKNGTDWTYSEGNLQISLRWGFWRAFPKWKAMTISMNLPSRLSRLPSQAELGGAGVFLTVLTFSLFILINTSVTRGVWVSSEGACRSLFFSPGSSHLFSQQVFQSSLLWRKKREKIPEIGSIGIWDWSDLIRNDRNTLNVNTLYKSGLIWQVFHHLNSLILP